MNTNGIRARLQGSLIPAMRAKDTATVSAVRSALAAIANAEALPPVELHTSGGDGPIAGARSGLGAGEAPRRELTEDDVRGILRAELDERSTAADELEAAGRDEAADTLRAEAAALERVLGS